MRSPHYKNNKILFFKILPKKFNHRKTQIKKLLIKILNNIYFKVLRKYTIQTKMFLLIMIQFQVVNKVKMIIHLIIKYQNKITQKEKH